MLNMFSGKIMFKILINISLLLLIIDLYNSKSSAIGLPSPIKIKNKVTQVFKRNGTNLNCFGIPVEAFSNAVENLFTEETKAKDIQYYFFSRDREDNVTISPGDELNLMHMNFDITRQTVFIVHGFMSSGHANWVREMKDAFLELDDYNVIVVNWQKGSNTWNYYAASISTTIVGTEIANLLKEIKKKAREMWPELKHYGPLYLVGHSLGAHICGHASYKTKEDDRGDEVSWNFQRITGLDPAQPCFKSADKSLKLGIDDAKYVDIIHSNGRSLILLGLGLPNQLGNIDFYPNGGQVQIGCNKIDTSIWSYLALPANVIKASICSHGRSHELFTDTIKVKLSGNCSFIGHEWDRKYDNITNLLEDSCDSGNCPEMGIDSIKYYDPDENKSYFVPTGPDDPYCVVTNEDKKRIIKQLGRDHAAKEVAEVANKILP